MAGHIELDPSLMAGAAAVSFIFTGIFSLIWWWCGWKCPCNCCDRRKEDRYQDEDLDDDEESGKPLGKTADQFLAEWEAKFHKSLKSPDAAPSVNVSGPPSLAAQRRSSANADRLVAMANTKLAQPGRRGSVAASSKARRLSMQAKDEEQVIWTGHGVHSQRKTIAELRDIAREEQQERMKYLTGMVDGDFGRKPRKPKERKAKRLSISSNVEEVPAPRRRAASLESPSQSSRLRPPTSSRAASAGTQYGNNDFSNLVSGHGLSQGDLKMLLPDATASDPPSPVPMKSRRRTSRREDSSAARGGFPDPVMSESLGNSQSRRRPSRGQEAPRAARTPSANLEVPGSASRRRSGSGTGEAAPRRAARHSDASREAPRRPKRSVAPVVRGRSTSPRPADEFGMSPPSLSTMPSKASTRRTAPATRDRNPDWPGMMNF